MSTLETILAKLKNKEAVIGIAGLGYVGLPLMLRYADVGCKVIGIDIDNAKVDLLNAGKSYIEHIASDSIASACKSGFEATTDFSRADLYDMVREVGAALGFMVVKSENCLRQHGPRILPILCHMVRYVLG